MKVPAEFDDNAIMIMRECAYRAGLLSNQYSRNLTFTTERMLMEHIYYVIFMKLTLKKIFYFISRSCRYSYNEILKGA
jgi:hypothetical protein